MRSSGGRELNDISAVNYTPACIGTTDDVTRGRPGLIARRWKHLGRESLEMLIGGPLDS